MLGLRFPAVLGGDEFDPVTQTLVLEALSNANASAGDGWGLKCLHWDAFQNARSSQCQMGKAEIVDGGYRLTWRWPFGSGVRHFEWMTAGPVVTRNDKPEHLMMHPGCRNCGRKFYGPRLGRQRCTDGGRSMTPGV